MPKGTFRVCKQSQRSRANPDFGSSHTTKSGYRFAGIRPFTFSYALSVVKKDLRSSPSRSYSGFPVPFTTSFVIRHSLIVSSDGTQNIVSIMISSMIARSPRAPVFRLREVSAIAVRASRSKTRRTPSSSSNFWYCFTIALFGYVRIRTSAS